MNWLFLSVAALGIAAVALLRHQPWRGQVLGSAAGVGAGKPVLRKATPLDRRIAALKLEKDPLERHRLLGEIVEDSHRQRADAAMKKIFLRFAGMHLKELPKEAAALRAEADGRLPAARTLTLLADVLEEDGRIKEAHSLRGQAAELGWNAGAEAEFNGRVRKRPKKIKGASPSTKRSGPGTARSRDKRRR